MKGTSRIMKWGHWGQVSQCSITRRTKRNPPKHYITKRFPGKDRQARHCQAGAEKSVISKREGDSHRIWGEVPQQKVKINGCPDWVSSFWRNLRKSFQANRTEVYCMKKKLTLLPNWLLLNTCFPILLKENRLWVSLTGLRIPEVRSAEMHKGLFISKSRRASLWQSSPQSSRVARGGPLPVIINIRGWHETDRPWGHLTVWKPCQTHKSATAPHNMCWIKSWTSSTQGLFPYQRATEPYSLRSEEVESS